MLSKSNKSIKTNVRDIKNDILKVAPLGATVILNYNGSRPTHFVHER